MDTRVPQVLCCDRIACNIMVVVDATMARMSDFSQTYMDTINDLMLLSLKTLQKGDSLTIFGILESLLHPTLSMLETLDSDMFNGASTTILEKSIQLTFDSFQQNTSYVKEQCQEQGVCFQILIKPGPLDRNKAILEEIVGLDITSIILHKTMDKYESFLSESLSSNTLAKHKDGMTKCMSSPVVLQAPLKTAPSALTAYEGVMATVMHKTLITEFGIERHFLPQSDRALDIIASFLPSESSWGSSAPMSPRSSLSLSVCPIDYKGIWVNDVSCGESSVPSARSSFSIDALDIATSLADLNTKYSYCYGSFGEYQSACGWLDMINQHDSCRTSSSSGISTPAASQVLDVSDVRCLTTEKAAPSLPMQPISVRPRRSPPTYNIVQVLEQAADLEESNELLTHNADCKDPQLAVHYGMVHSVSTKHIYSLEAARNSQKLQTNTDKHCSGASTSSHKILDSFEEPQTFQFEELEKATNNFSQQNLLADSIAGLTFKGSLNDGRTVIVKENKLASFHSDEQFVARVQLLGGLHHQNIVSIIGACKEKRLLVYEFVNNRSVDWHLAMSNPVTMNWHVRYKVAIGIAKALSFLHEGSQHAPITHGDLRSKNILLTNDYVPKIADAGLKWQPDDIGAETCLIGATGYLAPEYLESGTITQKTDIYAYGVVLLELITGFKASSRPNQQVCLTEWARLLLKEGKVDKLMDKRIENSIVEEQLCTATTIAMSCIDKDPGTRPQMMHVVQILERSLETYGNKSHIVSTRPIHQSRSNGKFASPVIRPRPGRSLTSHDSRQHLKYFLPTDCLHQTGCYKYTQPTSLHRMPRQGQRPQATLHPLHQIPQEHSPYPQCLANFHQMPQQWQLPWPVVRLPPRLPQCVVPEKDSTSHDKPKETLTGNILKGET